MTLKQFLDYFKVGSFLCELPLCGVLPTWFSTVHLTVTTPISSNLCRQSTSWKSSCCPRVCPYSIPSLCQPTSSRNGWISRELASGLMGVEALYGILNNPVWFRILFLQSAATFPSMFVCFLLKSPVLWFQDDRDRELCVKAKTGPSCEVPCVWAVLQQWQWRRHRGSLCTIHHPLISYWLTPFFQFSQSISDPF